jgi:hypothetical protein
MEEEKMQFQNNTTGEVLSHSEFVTFVWNEAERQYEDNNDGAWCNLTGAEQIELYCEQYEHQLKEREWVQLDV